MKIDVKKFYNEGAKMLVNRKSVILLSILLLICIAIGVYIISTQESINYSRRKDLIKDELKK